MGSTSAQSVLVRLRFFGLLARLWLGRLEPALQALLQFRMGASLLEGALRRRLWVDLVHSEVVFDWGSPIWYHSQVAFVVGGVTFLGPFSGGFSLGFPYLEPVSSAFLLGFPYFETQLEDPGKHLPREFVTIP